MEFEWPAKASASLTAEKLADAGLVRSAPLMRVLMALSGGLERIEPGLHLVQNDMSPYTLLRRLKRIPGGAKVRVTIPEGFNKFDIAKRLHEKGVCSRRALIGASTDPALIEELRLPAADTEGYMFPATYEFARNEQPMKVLRRMVAEADRRYARVLDSHAEAFAGLRSSFSWSRHEVVTLASIVEKEAATDEERPLVASVFLNRLRDETFRPARRLQSDPTARYGCLLQPGRLASCAGAEQGVTAPMVHDPLNPYSTYAHPGLPPGPICNPSEQSVKAVLVPANTKYLYFVARGGKRHTFSETYEEHKGAVQQRFGVPAAASASLPAGSH